MSEIRTAIAVLDSRFARCRKGDHSLVAIYSADRPGHEEVVRWCSICGAVSVDVEYDGRTNAGQVMKMRAPSALYRRKR